MYFVDLYFNDVDIRRGMRNGTMWVVCSKKMNLLAFCFFITTVITLIHSIMAIFVCVCCLRFIYCMYTFYCTYMFHFITTHLLALYCVQLNIWKRVFGKLHKFNKYNMYIYYVTSTHKNDVLKSKIFIKNCIHTCITIVISYFVVCDNDDA